ncbi:hypothetical protein [Pseudomonas phage Bertil]|uniref:Uncharacterized protein n=1 Tax=Pseudomonas phage Bertil TaxID=2801385 RepID=A0A7T8ER07_9CAUD|nr:hypothetical protein [Pseudomonas phage Bertil]QQO90895.1 hypothetical protein [Pseudomonas phage Strit]
MKYYLATPKSVLRDCWQQLSKIVEVLQGIILLLLMPVYLFVWLWVPDYKRPGWNTRAKHLGSKRP